MDDAIVAISSTVRKTMEAVQAQLGAFILLEPKTHQRRIKGLFHSASMHNEGLLDHRWIDETLRCFLRQDPDIILVGEIRDKETAEVALEASLTGHLLFSTLHTNDASSTVVRLVEIGVEPFLVATTLILS